VEWPPRIFRAVKCHSSWSLRESSARGKSREAVIGERCGLVKNARQSSCEYVMRSVMNFHMSASLFWGGCDKRAELIQAEIISKSKVTLVFSKL